MKRRNFISRMFAMVALFSLTESRAQTCAEPLKEKVRLLNQSVSVPLCELTQGKVCLFVNVASHCGFTYQYEALEKLQQTYQKKGFTVIGVPSSDFFQEKDKESDIAQFCQLNYGVSFPMLEKSHVRGSDATPLFKWLQAETDTSIKWNFYKFLVDKNGKPIQAFASMTEPTDAKLIAAIESLL